MLRDLSLGLVRATGNDVQRLGRLGWLVRPRSRRGGRRSQATARSLGRGSWVIERRGRRTLRRIGNASARTDLLYDPRAARTHMHSVQKQLSGFLAEEMVAWTLRELGIDCVIDVGANVGQYAQKLRRSGYRGRIVSFEPLPELAEQLRTLAAADPDWVVHECALGEENTTAEINVTPGTLSSLLSPSDFGRSWSAKLREVETLSVQVRRLDALFDEILAGLDERRVFLKMDTQGYDLQAFRGAGERIAEVLAMQSEVACLAIYDEMPRLPEVVAEYEAAGFETVGMYPVSRHAQTLRVIELDLVMVRASAFPGAGR